MFMKWLTVNLRMNRWIRRTLIICLSVVMMASIAGCGLLPDEDQEEQLPTITPPKLSQKPVYEVTTETLITRVRGIDPMFL